MPSPIVAYAATKISIIIAKFKHFGVSLGYVRQVKVILGCFGFGLGMLA